MAIIRLTPSNHLTIITEGHRIDLHTSAAQETLHVSATFENRLPLRSIVEAISPEENTALIAAIARVAYAMGVSAGGGDMSEVILTPPHYTDAITKEPGRYMGATALLHYSDDSGGNACPIQATRIGGFTGAANVVAAIIEGAAVCPFCAKMHATEVAMVKKASAAESADDDPTLTPDAAPCPTCNVSSARVAFVGRRGIYVCATDGEFTRSFPAPEEAHHE